VYLLNLNHKWFHLGLSLGLGYHTLKNIHYNVDGDHMTNMLQKWLRGVDLETTTEGVRGALSWRALALALDSPLVREGQVACKIKKEHNISAQQKL